MPAIGTTMAARSARRNRVAVRITSAQPLGGPSQHVRTGATASAVRALTDAGQGFWDPPRTGQERVDVFGHLDVREVTFASQHVLTNVEGERTSTSFRSRPCRRRSKSMKWSRVPSSDVSTSPPGSVLISGPLYGAACGIAATFQNRLPARPLIAAD